MIKTNKIHYRFHNNYNRLATKINCQRNRTSGILMPCIQ